MTEERVVFEKVEEKPKIAWEIFKVGGITFGITAIAPIVFTILFLIEYWYQIRSGVYSLDYYGNLDIGQALGGVIFYWLMICLPLTITNTLGKGILYTRYKVLIFFMPVLFVGLIVGFLFLSFWITDGLGGNWF